MKTKSAASTTTVAVVDYPHASHVDEFEPLNQAPGVRLVWARSPRDCEGANRIVLPGSSAMAADLAWLRAQGLDRAIAEHAQQGGAVLGICEGLQMLGEALVDTEHIDGNAPGLGLLPLVTAVSADPGMLPATACFNELRGPWSALSGVQIQGQAMQHRQTAQHPAMAAAGHVARAALPDGLGWVNSSGHVLGIYLHGLFQNPGALQALKAP